MEEKEIIGALAGGIGDEGERVLLLPGSVDPILDRQIPVESAGKRIGAGENRDGVRCGWGLRRRRICRENILDRERNHPVEPDLPFERLFAIPKDLETGRSHRFPPIHPFQDVRIGNIRLVSSREDQIQRIASLPERDEIIASVIRPVGIFITFGPVVRVIPVRLPDFSIERHGRTPRKNAGGQQEEENCP